jgi:hypothetical protein
MAAYRKTGTRRIHEITADTTAIAVGDLVRTNGNDQEVIAAASNSAILGIALEASANGTTAPIKVDILAPGDAIMIDVEAGTPTMGLWDKGDINSADGITLTNTNDDFYFQYLGDYDGTTYSVLAYPTHLELSQGT